MITMDTSAQAAPEASPAHFVRTEVIPPTPNPDLPISDEKPRPIPVATLCLIAVLIGVFVCEQIFAITPATAGFNVSLLTAVALGGSTKALVVEQGEIFRLLTMGFLHFNPIHLVLNCAALFLAGRSLEPLTGGLWLIALFVLGAIGSALASVHFNVPGLVALGVSGGIMALGGFMFALALRHPDKKIKKTLLTDATFLLMAVLMPLFFSTEVTDTKMQVDHAAHIGGAVMGFVIASLSVAVWPNVLERPRWHLLAWAICGTALLVGTVGVGHLSARTEEFKQVAYMIPRGEFPENVEALKALSEAFVRLYPTDAQSHFYRGLAQLDKDNVASEQSARRAVELTEKYPGLYTSDFVWRPRFLHAMILSFLNRQDDALAVGSSLCRMKIAEDSMSRLKRRGICGENTVK
jgi:membrane associated rhomboid family serine protease